MELWDKRSSKSVMNSVCGKSVYLHRAAQALSGKDEPYQNCFLYDGVNSTGIVEYIGP